MSTFGLLGEKLGHSFSPQIHALLDGYAYSLFETPEDRLEEFLKSGSFDGLNVTVPYKKKVIPFLDSLSELAERIGSVNTIKADETGLHGFNTDYFGFSRMLSDAGIDVKDRRCVVLGNGGASATVQTVLHDLGAAEVAVVEHRENTPERIRELKSFQIVVNATPVGMYPHNGESPVDLSLFDRLLGVADIVFNPLKTALILQAESLGIPFACGLTMLVAQAKQSAEIFTGKTIPDERIREIAGILRRQCRSLVLIGMPGSGKTTVARQLAKRMHRPLIDTDREIAFRAGKPVPRIIEEDGEEAFRELETAVLRDVTKRTGAVIATGGGCVTQPRNIPLLRQNGFVIFLERPLHLLARGGRPLSAGKDAVAKLYKARLPLYLSACDLRIRNDRPPEEMAAQLLKRTGYER